MPDQSTVERVPGVEGSPMSAASLQVYTPQTIHQRLNEKHQQSPSPAHPGHDLRWLTVLDRSMRQRPYLIEMFEGESSVGLLPLSLVDSFLFGRFLVSLPYISSAGIRSDDPAVAAALISKAVELADELDCRYLEIRDEVDWKHSALNGVSTEKVHMRLALPPTVDDLWNGIKSSVRNQVRKGQRPGFDVCWGSHELLPGFYDVFSRRMRELGTPVYGRKLFEEILTQFGERAEICTIQDGKTTAAAALLVHGTSITEVPSASARTEYNPANVNMLMYWQLLSRSVERGQGVFDFGRASKDSNPYRFKKQWGAEPHDCVWQYYVRKGTADALRPSNSRNQRLIKIWRKLPLWLTRIAGPAIVRGIP